MSSVSPVNISHTYNFLELFLKKEFKQNKIGEIEIEMIFINTMSFHFCIIAL